MRHLNGVYTQLFNRAHRRVGHLFQGRYKAILVEKEKYLLSLSRYIVLNPVRVGIAERPEDYKWSSYRYTAGHDKPHEYLSVDWVLAQFGQDRATAEKRYRQFVLSGDEGNPFDKVKGQSILGTDTFVSRFIDYLWEKEPIKEIPRKHRYAGRPPLEALFTGEAKAKGPARDEVICETVLEYGYTLKEIADFLNLHYTTVSKVINKDKERLTKK